MSVFKDQQEEKVVGDVAGNHVGSNVANVEAQATFLAKDTKIKGQVEASCDLHLDGTFQGGVVCKGAVFVGNTGFVKSTVKAEKVVVSGKIEGNVLAKVVEIKPSGSIVGSVTSEEFVIERNGTFEGESHHKEFTEESLTEKTQEAKKTRKSVKKTAKKAVKKTTRAKKS